MTGSMPEIRIHSVSGLKCQNMSLYTKIRKPDVLHKMAIRAYFSTGSGLWAPGDLNPEPADYESVALTVELGARFVKNRENLLAYDGLSKQIHGA